MEKKSFGRTKEGREAFIYAITNSNGMEALFTDYGATLVSLFVKDRAGNRRDVILGYDDVAEYQKNTHYFGATVGRNANRISDAKITIDGTEYLLDANDHENNLHSGQEGLSDKFWTVKEQSGDRITFQYNSPDGEGGFPGNAVIEVTYGITEDNSFTVSYHAVSDRKTVFNMTNHGYYNLNGHDAGEILAHELQINASCYTPVKSAKAIPTGEIAAVEGTPFDFRTAKPIGQDIRKEHEQLGFGNGYDHNFAIDRKTDGIETAAIAYSPESGIQMEVLTDCIGIQLYTANFIQGQIGKGGAAYRNNGAFCLETQYFPNAINEPNFVSPLTDADSAYESRTVYHFSVK